MNRLFVVNKPIFQSSNGYMRTIKRRYGVRKVGYSGTLDPFATGCLIVATGQYTKLFNYLNKTPKTYRATLWLGAHSPSLDIENVDRIRDVAPFEVSRIETVLCSLQGTLTYTPPAFCAKKVGGKRAYTLARQAETVDLEPITSTIHTIRLITYNHPFIHFEATVSEGTYIRSLGAMIANRLGVEGTLSSLHRVSEGAFRFTNETPLDPFQHLAIPRNRYTGDETYLETGKKLSVAYFANQNDGVYLVETARFFAIIEIKANEVTYRLNRLEKFHAKENR